jgi:hypothetical protein
MCVLGGVQCQLGLSFPPSQPGRVNCHTHRRKRASNRLVFTPIQNVGRTSPMHVPGWHLSPPPHTHGRSKLASHATAPALARVAGMIMLRAAELSGAGFDFAMWHRDARDSKNTTTGPWGGGSVHPTIILYTGATLPVPVGDRYCIPLLLCMARS